jgi:hypothetical protein
VIERARNGVRSWFIVPRVFAAEDQVVVRTDGTLLVARAGQHIVEHRAPDGVMRRQQRVRATTSRVSAADMDTTTAWRVRGLTEGEEKDWLVPSGSTAMPDGSLLLTLQPADGRSSVRVMQVTATLDLRELSLAPGSRLVGWDVREPRVIAAREEDDGVRLDWVDSRFKRGGGRDR